MGTIEKELTNEISTYRDNLIARPYCIKRQIGISEKKVIKRLEMTDGFSVPGYFLFMFVFEMSK